MPALTDNTEPVSSGPAPCFALACPHSLPRHFQGEQRPGLERLSVPAKVTGAPARRRAPPSAALDKGSIWSVIEGRALYCLVSFFTAWYVLRVFGEIPHKMGSWLTPPLSDRVTCSPFGGGGPRVFQTA